MRSTTLLSGRHKVPAIAATDLRVLRVIVGAGAGLPITGHRAGLATRLERLVDLRLVTVAGGRARATARGRVVARVATGS